jgi:sporadic carbohydrate cluster 2OG-Fe(II) oxygenase
VKNKIINKLQNDFLKKGFCIFKINNMQSLYKVRNKLKKLSKVNNLNLFHKKVSFKEINKIRIKIFKSINKDKKFRTEYIKIFRSYLDEIIGNEIGMQKTINLNIQMPQDRNSLIEMHADSYSGESNFEVITWLPLVNVNKTKSLYVFPLKKTKEIEKKFNEFNFKGTDSIFNRYKKNIKFLDIKFGEALIFSSNILHGNKINLENETRWSLNCRFKNIFAPQNPNLTNKTDVSLFENISLKPASILALNYVEPIIK